ncbi:HU domain-containing protein [Psychroflexus aestuariivivens]|uniref:HU domain-containing protein n=1 Tax=Psychroflexus aestuariivivens TaxID=1795040 RepID=UPI000FDC207B|nr:SPOR domain-containing protein [Psychroflexus aestuariivivens]
MRVEDYIKALLYRYECVIVPDFGAFITQRISAELNAEESKFLPPKKQISFNRQVKNQDGLLTEYIAKSENISFSDAKQKIKNFVEDIFLALDEQQKIELDSIGVFLIDKSDKLVFEPNTEENYLLDSYGMETLEIEKVYGKVVDFQHELKPNKEVDEVPNSNEQLDATEEIKPKPYLKYAAVGILALGLAGFAGFFQYQNHVEDHNLSEAKKAERLIQDKIQSANFSVNFGINEIEIDSKVEDKLKPKYHVIAGAFRVKSNADKKVNILQNKGYNAKVIGENKYGLHQVVFESFVDENKALLTLRQVKRSENPDAWLFVNEL